jgi:hypothetical protein
VRISWSFICELQVVNSQLGDMAALHGAAYLVSDLVYAPAAVDQMLARKQV